MSDTSYIGIDYGMGQANIDTDTGIRFGVIHQGEILQAWSDSSEADYGDPSCPECGSTVVASDSDEARQGELFGVDPNWNDGKDFACLACHKCWWSDAVYGDEPLSFHYSGAGIEAEQSGDDCDIFVLKSPFYTRAQFCSPCAPGAAYLANPCADGPKAYCFGHDWFEDGEAPYPVYRVSDDALIESVPQNG